MPRCRRYGAKLNPKRMVRIAFKNRVNRATLISLLVMMAAAAGIWVCYWSWHHEEELVPVQRDLGDFVVHWRCPQGHVFAAKGACQSIPCPTCRQPAHILITYLCPTHGPVGLLVMYDETTCELTHVQYGSGDWVSAVPFIRCPHCGCRMRPKGSNLFPKITPSDK